MPKRKHSNHSNREKHGGLSHKEHERKQRVLTQGRASTTRSISDAVVIKDGDIFFLTEPDGSVPVRGGHGFGLYYHDCRFLNGYELKLVDTKPDVLVSTAERGFMSIFELTNSDINVGNGKSIRKENIGIKWERIIDNTKLTLHDLITVRNFGIEQVELPISLSFQSAFEPLFAVRGLMPKKLGKPRRPIWRNGALSLIYDGADGIYRSLSVQFSPKPKSTDETTAQFQIPLRPEEEKQILISLVIAESKSLNKVKPKSRRKFNLKGVEGSLRSSCDKWLDNHTEVKSDNPSLNKVLDRSLRDLHILKTKINKEGFFAAGVPWFVTLFGRDSIIASLQTLAFEPGIAEQTLRLLANYQGQKVDQWRDEEPGKIMHELRIGELAHLNEIPQTPYYGTVDATPLFLILISRYAAWTVDLKVFNDLRENVELALAWMSNYGDKNQDGYIEYESASGKGLVNQGWKDSGDAIVNADGSLAKPPISLVEVQGYVYFAKITIADLYERVGEKDRADRLRQEAEGLYSQFNRDFWLDDKKFYALALQAKNKPASVISSNPGQSLWSGIIDPHKAKQTVERLMADDMFSGWGIRTLSEKEKRYNPIGYHLGTVWPHDNSIIASGFRRYGFDKEACRVFTGILDAAMCFDHHRLPEVFSGFRREDFGIPVHYPVACHPQAWAAGSIPYFIETLLGLVPKAFDNRLRIVRPVLPDSINRADITGLRIGKARISLRFERASNGNITVKVLNVNGRLDVGVEF